MNSRVTGLHYSMPMDNIASVMQHGILCCERAASTDKSWPKALLSNCPLDGGAYEPSSNVSQTNQEPTQHARRLLHALSLTFCENHTDLFGAYA